MPYFTIRDLYGTCFQLTSSEPEVIKGWLIEMCRKASSVNSMMGPMTITVNPISLNNDYNAPVYDWPISGIKQYAEYRVQADALIRLAEMLEQFRLREEIRSNEVAAAEWCDFANHPFKAGQTGTMRAAIKKEDGTQDERVICPECAALMGVNDDYKAPQSPADRKAAIEAAKPGK